MNIAIMQPYFLPYIGYFQLLQQVDRFVIYDKIQYTKKGWINRNRMLRNGEPVMFSVPLKKASDYLDIRDRTVAEAYSATKLGQQIAGAYQRAPRFKQVMPLIQSLLSYESQSLFDFLHNNLTQVCAYLEIGTPIVISSEIEPPTELCNQDRVLDICQRMGASVYTNPIGGFELYQSESFAAQGIKLQFLQTSNVSYEQFSQPFQAHLSILDVMMFNTPEQIQAFLNDGYDLIIQEGSSSV